MKKNMHSVKNQCFTDTQADSFVHNFNNNERMSKATFNLYKLFHVQLR